MDKVLMMMQGIMVVERAEDIHIEVMLHGDDLWRDNIWHTEKS